MASRTVQLVNDRAGEYLREAAHGVPVPESFLAALTANESLGDTAAMRPEPAVFSKLLDVLLGKRAHYHDVTAGMLVIEDSDPALSESYQGYFHRQIYFLERAASSWGFTQIMGYHVLRWGGDMSDLVVPAKHYAYTLRLLMEEVEKWNLDPSKDFEKMARCWNTGKPDGKTYHKDYVPNILRRMTQWAQIHPEG